MPTRLLLVDGDLAVQRMVEQVAQSLGLDASCFKDAITALDAIGRLKPSLVIADYRMTGTTFIAFCERIAGMELASPPPIVTLASADDQFDEAELRFLGVKAFVRKPPQPDTLHDTILQLCTDLGLTLATPKPGRTLPPGSADLADLIAREVGRQLPLALQAELPGQIARAYPREDMTLIAMEAVQQALPDISHQLLADLKPMIQERVKEMTEQLVRELIDKRVAEHSSDSRDRGA